MSTELRAKFTADSTGFSQEIGKVEGMLGRIGGALAGAFSVGAIVNAVRSAAAFADEIDNVSKAAGLSLGAVQSLRVMAQEAGQSFEQLQSAVVKIQGAQFEALSNGASKSAQSLKAMGLSIDDLASMDSQQIVEAFAAALRNGSGDADVMAAALDIIGARSAKLLPILKELGEKGFGGIAAEMRKLGMLVSDDDIARLDAAELIVARTKTKAQATGTSWLASLIGNYQTFGGIFSGKSQLRPDASFADMMKGATAGGVVGMISAMFTGAAASSSRTGGVLAAPGVPSGLFDPFTGAQLDAAAAKEKGADSMRDLRRRVEYETIRTGGTLAAPTDEMRRSAEAQALAFADKLADMGALMPGDMQTAQDLFMRLEQLSDGAKTKRGDAQLQDIVSNASMVDRLAQIGALSGRGAVDDVPRRQLAASEQSLAELRKLNAKGGELILA